MNKREFDQMFYHDNLSQIKEMEKANGCKDYPARRMAYNDALDFYRREDSITEAQVRAWVMPKKWDRPSK
jgi:hypothetical protein